MTQLLEAPAETDAPQIDFDALVRETRPTRLKLSEAIRQGSAETDQAIGMWEHREDDRLMVCALGAACYVAVGNKRSMVGSLEEAARYFPEVLETVTVTRFQFEEYADAPTPMLPWTLGDHILYLNDTVKADRERIADIVEALGY
jgi:hypothetical protein